MHVIYAERVLLIYKGRYLGPYDELVFIPGNFETPQGKGKKNLRVTRIYVSQRDTCYNGTLGLSVLSFSYSPTLTILAPQAA